MRIIQLKAGSQIMDDQKIENKLMRVIATLFIVLFCVMMFIKFLFF